MLLTPSFITSLSCNSTLDILAYWSIYIQISLYNQGCRKEVSSRYHCNYHQHHLNHHHHHCHHYHRHHHYHHHHHHHTNNNVRIITFDPLIVIIKESSSLSLVLSYYHHHEYHHFHHHHCHHYHYHHYHYHTIVSLIITPSSSMSSLLSLSLLRHHIIWSLFIKLLGWWIMQIYCFENKIYKEARVIILQ